MGKNAGEDIAEGKPTLPLILARERCNEKERALLDEAIRNGGADDLNPVLAIIEKTGSIKASMDIAKTHADEAMQAVGILPGSRWRTALEQLAEYSVSRKR